MEIRRPVAALLTALALVGGGASLSACAAAGQDQNDGTTDDGGNTGEATRTSSSESADPLPDNSDRETDSDTGRAGGNGKGTP